LGTEPGGNFSGARDITLVTGIHVVSDDELMGRVRAGSATAFEVLFERYRASVWRFFRRRTADAGRAEELVQDTFVAVLEAAARYEMCGAFRAFLFGIAYNVLLADRRKAAHRAADLLNDEMPATSTKDPEAEDTSIATRISFHLKVEATRTKGGSHKNCWTLQGFTATHGFGMNSCSYKLTA
jgi:Sigma-70 region 2